MSALPKDYLGDSVYVEFDGSAIILTTNNGYHDDPRNRIVLGYDEARGLVEYIRHVDALNPETEAIILP